MQRRWAAIYLAFFLVMAGSAYSVMAVAEEPAMDIEGDTYQQGDTLEANGTTYTVAELGEGEASLAYNTTVEQETTFANNSVVEYGGDQYNVTVESGEEPNSFTLTQEFDVGAILQNDSRVDNQTYQREDGTEFVRYENGTTQPLDEYLPDPDQEQFSVGDSIEHGGTTKTVQSVSSSEAVLTWEETTAESIGLEEGGVVTVGGTEYVATFPDNSTVLLSTDVEGYEQVSEDREYFQERTSGLMYVVIFSVGAGFLLAAMALMPRRE
ncbi:hypothetical protein HWV23_08320 [Natronomonas halophila]|uniref:hypothetical protein n=1 Tax=Natronomonas halophila TaxID=2747817 RepID=UPI0015B3F048|nr:hypothetical protein [Natronomonas halophila]QLD85729.1 hypothetical protein HWV23_08320 [Natronomonas halophila]